MRALVVLSAVVAALAIASPAAAGGWASVGFEPLPDGGSAGSTWRPTIFVKQHGVTPLAGLQPVVTIHATDSLVSSTFLAEPSDEAGVYRANVVFPSSGDWRVTIHSGFGDSQVTYGPVAIGPAVGASGSRELPGLGLGVAVLGLLGGLAFFAVRRSRRLSPVS
ncbi:MAG TPA: hypothetical protein VMN35_07360 [Gaiellaceae bacterium]|nr:hypothetical protein [Gaiellaceae bacterium]